VNPDRALTAAELASSAPRDLIDHSYDMLVQGNPCRFFGGELTTRAAFPSKSNVGNKGEKNSAIPLRKIQKKI